MKPVAATKLVIYFDIVTVIVVCSMGLGLIFTYMYVFNSTFTSSSELI